MSELRDGAHYRLPDGRTVQAQWMSKASADGQLVPHWELVYLRRPTGKLANVRVYTVLPDGLTVRHWWRRMAWTVADLAPVEPVEPPEAPT